MVEVNDVRQSFTSSPPAFDVARVVTEEGGDGGQQGEVREEHLEVHPARLVRHLPIPGLSGASRMQYARGSHHAARLGSGISGDLGRGKQIRQSP
jgi:hypothetical protein